MLEVIPAQLGYSALFGVILAESAGLPIPGETVLLAAGVMAGAGQLTLPLVIAVAAAAAILGDSLGYAIGRRGGRALLLRDGPCAAWRGRSLQRAEGFFARYGEAAVMLARWVPVARYLTPLAAGAAEMSWRRFQLFNVAGAVGWCASLAFVAATLGPAGAASVSLIGLVVTAAGAVAGAIRALAARRRSPAPEPALASVSA